MTTLRTVGILVVLVAATSLAVGSVGFSDVSAERAVQVAVTGNEEAYVGVQACHEQNSRGNESADNGSAAPVRVRVTNRYVDAFLVTSITSADAAVSGGNLGTGDTVDVGNSKQYEQTFASTVSTVSVSVSGDHFEATVTRPVVSKSECPFRPNE